MWKRYKIESNYPLTINDNSQTPLFISNKIDHNQTFPRLTIVPFFFRKDTFANLSLDRVLKNKFANEMIQFALRDA